MMRFAAWWAGAAITYITEVIFTLLGTIRQLWSFGYGRWQFGYMFRYVENYPVSERTGIGIGIIHDDGI
jgi:hypothetical protein